MNRNPYIFKIHYERYLSITHGKHAHLVESNDSQIFLLKKNDKKITVSVTKIKKNM